jgi:ATP-dependent exoDNAse (exonuclease V) beta subunit
MHQAGDVEGSVRPGLHGFAEEGYQVVWWDPAVLELGVEGAQGLRHEDILAPAGEAALENRLLYEEWKTREAEIRARGRRPSLRVTTVTELDEEPPRFARVTIEACGRAAERPVGKRFGSLVHRVLELVELDGDATAVERLVESQARLLEASPEERAAAVLAVGEALGSAAVVAARSAVVVHREAPFTLALEDGRLVEGTVDLLFRETADGPWTVVDFKTEPDVDRWQESWIRQLGWYAYAIEELLGGGVSGVVLAV